MMHLNRTTCCGHQFTANDIKGRLMNQKQALNTNEPNLWGGNAERFAYTSCPKCQREYVMWLKIQPPNYRVLTLSDKPGSKREGLPSPDDREALKSWLDDKGIEYAKNLSNEKLYEKVNEHSQTALV